MWTRQYRQYVKNNVAIHTVPLKDKHAAAKQFSWVCFYVFVIARLNITYDNSMQCVIGVIMILNKSKICFYCHTINQKPSKFKFLQMYRIKRPTFYKSVVIWWRSTTANMHYCSLWWLHLYTTCNPVLTSVVTPVVLIFQPPIGSFPSSSSCTLPLFPHLYSCPLCPQIFLFSRSSSVYITHCGLRCCNMLR